MTKGYVLSAAVCAAAVPIARASIEGQLLGPYTPPATLGGFALGAFPPDLRAPLTYVTDAPAPDGRLLTFGATTVLHRAGDTWMFWGHDYFGPVYDTDGSLDMTMQLPVGTRAFIVYACAEPLLSAAMTVTCSNGFEPDKTLVVSVPSVEAFGVGFYSTGPFDLQSVTIHSSWAFAVGEFLMAPACQADLTIDGVVDFSDYLEFLNLYDAGDLRVDFNGDGFVDFSDYLEFLNLFDHPC
ncbi:MAG: hypothetical protein IT436_12095 [Phycisphaerales bacterium]|nr:hypothetical protein [Phycisphaerales bacterium]